MKNIFTRWGQGSYCVLAGVHWNEGVAKGQISGVDCYMLIN